MIQLAAIMCGHRLDRTLDRTWKVMSNVHVPLWLSLKKKTHKSYC